MNMLFSTKVSSHLIRELKHNDDYGGKKKSLKLIYAVQNSSLSFYVVQDICCLYAVLVVIIALVI